MLRRDAWRLNTLLTRHVRYTGSARAQAILDAWSDCLPRFVKVTPLEFRRALESRSV